MDAIELKDASFIYPNGFLANEDLNLTVFSSERVAIVGQNGAGKTTAVKMMNGLHKPTKGQVLVNGVDTKTRTTAQIAAHVGYVFQNPDDQIFNKDVLSEIEYMPRYFKLSEEEIKRRTEHAVEMTKIRDYLKINPFEIPYAIRKFVSIAAVLATQPEYVILDEPTAGQDLRGIEILQNILNTLQEERIAVIAITHDMEFVANNFTRVVAMADKKIIADGDVRDIFWNDEVLSKSRIRRPQIGELSYDLKFRERVLYLPEMIKLLQQKLGGDYD